MPRKLLVFGSSLKMTAFHVPICNHPSSKVQILHRAVHSVPFRKNVCIPWKLYIFSLIVMFKHFQHIIRPGSWSCWSLNDKELNSSSLYFALKKIYQLSYKHTKILTPPVCKLYRKFASYCTYIRRRKCYWKSLKKQSLRCTIFSTNFFRKVAAASLLLYVRKRAPQLSSINHATLSESGAMCKYIQSSSCSHHGEYMYCIGHNHNHGRYFYIYWPSLHAKKRCRCQIILHTVLFLKVANFST